MSTRANVIIKDDGMTLYFYRHSDGYPECTGESLKEFVKGYSKKEGHMRLDAMQSAGWLVLHGADEYYKDEPRQKGYDHWKVGAYEPTDRIHGDAEYIYIIDLDEGTLSCRVPTKFMSDDECTLADTKACKEFKTVHFMSVDLEECEHVDIDDFHCLDCGKDMTESLMSQAYDQAKDMRKYGE